MRIHQQPSFVNARRSRVTSDLRKVFSAFPLKSLIHLRDNFGRLIRRSYTNEVGGGCLMYLLSEPLEESKRIDSKQTLVGYFGGDEDGVEYQPAKWIVRLWDQRVCHVVTARYGPKPQLTADHVREVLLEEIERRLAEEAETQSPPQAPAAVLREGRAAGCTPTPEPVTVGA